MQFLKDLWNKLICKCTRLKVKGCEMPVDVVECNDVDVEVTLTDKVCNPTLEVINSVEKLPTSEGEKKKPYYRNRKPKAVTETITESKPKPKKRKKKSAPKKDN